MPGLWSTVQNVRIQHWQQFALPMQHFNSWVYIVNEEFLILLHYDNWSLFLIPSLTEETFRSAYYFIRMLKFNSSSKFFYAWYSSLSFVYLLWRTISDILCWKVSNCSKARDDSANMSSWSLFRLLHQGEADYNKKRYRDLIAINKGASV
jgi:hypothetical protein